MISPTPFSPDELTAGWLTETLRRRGALESGSVSAFEVEQVGRGSGFLSQLLRIHLSCDAPDSEAPSTVIAKLPSMIPAVQQLALRTGMYFQEVSFYQDFSEEAGIGIPQCYFAAMSEDKSRFVLLLEDLKGGAFGDQLAGCSPAEARDVITEIARFHACWWNHPRLKQLPWLKGSTPELRDRLATMYEARLPAFLAYAEPLLTPSALSFCPALAKNLRPLLEKATAKNHFTLGHGDFRADNIFFPVVSGVGRRLVVLDWQRANRAWSGTNDIANFLGMGLSTENLVAQREALLECYYAEFAKSGIDDFSFADLCEGYRVSLLQTLLFVIVASGLVEVEVKEKRSTDLAVVIFARLLGAIEEAQAWELLA